MRSYLGGRGWHAGITETRRSPGGKHEISVGCRAGYWPCLEAPFVTATILKWRIDLWYGLPSYWA